MPSTAPRLMPIIAVVNHDPVFLGMMAEFLGGEGYEVAAILADDQALERIRALLPDLALLDVSVHRRDASWALVEAVCGGEGTGHVPVIVVTADIAWSRAHAAMVAAHGCTLLEKPFHLGALEATIDRLLGATAAG
jgi:CheY-like chemotaxis protein